MFGMKYLWKSICADEDQRNIHKFIAAYTSLCVLLIFAVCAVAGLFTGFHIGWLEATLIITGYIGMGLGFFGSIIYAYRQ